jgi:hypothetical protein
MENNSQFRTFIYKDGDSKASSIITQIINEGWQISCITPTGSVRITSFQKNTNN